MNIIGIDPSLNSTGWAILSVHDNNYNEIRLVDNGSILTSNKKTIGERLNKIYSELLNILNSYKVDTASMEEIFINKNPKSSTLLCYARGVLLLTLNVACIPLFEYSANRVKKSITGNGHAKKEQVCFMIENILNIKCHGTYDISDAIAVAICHIYSIKAF